ncbi:MAG: radical SAM protein [Magnetococcales bacterium]|nr:radical SAM protein [Magnetococcales bacterium]
MQPADNNLERSEQSLNYLSNRLGFAPETLLRFPKYFLIETINQCNARCIMCGIDFDGKKTARLSKTLFEKMAEEIGEYRDHVEKVMLYLDGEPLLDRSLPERISLMKSKGVKRVNVATNASILMEKQATRLIDAGLDEIYITVDSLKKEIYETIRVGLKFETVMENIQTFIQLRNRLNPALTIRMQMVQQELNRDEGENFHTFWQARLGSQDQVVVQKAHNWGSTVQVLRRGDEDQVNDIPCIALWGTFVVHVDGTVPLCCMDTDSRHPVGDLNSQSIREVWQSKELAAYRRKHLLLQRPQIDICDGCTLWREEKHT